MTIELSDLLGLDVNGKPASWFRQECELDGYANLKGIYILVNNGEILYVGQSGDLPKRVRTHFAQGVITFDMVYFFEVKQELQRDIEESRCLDLLKPPMNKKYYSDAEIERKRIKAQKRLDDQKELIAKTSADLATKVWTALSEGFSPISIFNLLKEYKFNLQIENELAGKSREPVTLEDLLTFQL